MHLTYNGYSHEENEVWFNIQKLNEFSPRGRPMKQHQTWTIRGVLIGTSESDLTNKINALESAYSIGGGDLLFYGNSNTVTAHAMRSSYSTNGVQIGRIQWLEGNKGIWGSGTEYQNKRSYQIVARAEYLATGDNIVSYHTTISAKGNCGPNKLWQGSLTGTPQQQIVQLFTTQKIAQMGRAIGLTGYPIPDGPLWPGIPENEDLRNPSYDSPLRVGINISTHWPVSWKYFFESSTPLVAA